MFIILHVSGLDSLRQFLFFPFQPLFSIWSLLLCPLIIPTSGTKFMFFPSWFLFFQKQPFWATLQAPLRLSSVICQVRALSSELGKLFEVREN